MNKLIVTTSWDDGNQLDIPVAELLKKYNLKGTFYIPIIYEKKNLCDKDIIDLSKDFEIGSHSYSHRDLTRLPKNEVIEELENSKFYLEKLVGREISSFSYPYGKYNKEVEKLIENTGYLFARTVEYDGIYAGPLKNPMSSSVGCYLSNKENIMNIFKLIHVIKVNALNGLDWESKAKTVFNILLRKGGIYHLWGHSWEYTDFCKLERVFEYISNNENCTYMTNDEVRKLYI